MSYYEDIDPVRGPRGIWNGLVFTAMCIVLVWLIVHCCGCSSIRRGDFSVDSFGTDVAIKSAEWRKDGNTESLILKGAEKNGSESVHTTANLVMGVIGAIIGGGASGGVGAVPGAAIGLASGISVGEVWQTVKDKYLK